MSSGVRGSQPLDKYVRIHIIRMVESPQKGGRGDDE
jgi:hypothetical protein